MTNPLAPHLDIALRHAPSDLPQHTDPARRDLRGTGFDQQSPCLYRSMVCFIQQGSKRAAINDQVLSYDSQHYLISALDLPLTGQILDDEEGWPYTAISLVLDPAQLVELAATMPTVRESDRKGVGIAINPMTDSLRAILFRLVSLLDTPADIPVLGPMVE
ncbi:AraC family transcriptional regulator [Achromobacter spanius]|uniref:AraC family transcriptional regulator n=1 Tax=Achromobacter spanius TaxID=217203 RepID=UPI0036EA44C1